MTVNVFDGKKVVMTAQINNVDDLRRILVQVFYTFGLAKPDYEVLQK